LLAPCRNLFEMIETRQDRAAAREANLVSTGEIATDLYPADRDESRPSSRFALLDR
jgi:hypothetical protein